MQKNSEIPQQYVARWQILFSLSTPVQLLADGELNWHHALFFMPIAVLQRKHGSSWQETFCCSSQSKYQFDINGWGVADMPASFKPKTMKMQWFFATCALEQISFFSFLSYIDGMYIIQKFILFNIYNDIAYNIIGSLRKNKTQMFKLIMLRNALS